MEDDGSDFGRPAPDAAEGARRSHKTARPDGAW